MIVINSKKDGFRRGGHAHPAEPKQYPDGHFTGEQLAQIKAEPMLVVQEIPDAPQDPTGDDLVAGKDLDVKGTGKAKAGK